LENIIQVGVAKCHTPGNRQGKLSTMNMIYLGVAIAIMWFCIYSSI